MLNFAFALPAIAAIAVWRMPSDRLSSIRLLALGSVLASLVCCVLAGIHTTGALAAAALSALALLALAGLPKREWRSAPVAGMLMVVSGTIAAYASSSLTAFCAAWAVTAAPLLLGWFGAGGRTRIFTAANLALLLAAAMLEPAPAAFPLMVAAALIRAGVFPFQFWIASAFEQTSPACFNLFANGHMGALLLARFGLKLFPAESAASMGMISSLVLVTAVYAALVAQAERSTRRLLALLAVSQASFILAGLESRTAEGLTGAALHALVVAAATTGLTLAYAHIEARCPQAANPDGYLGLASRMPRIAVLFTICGLALVGLPGTLGFVSEDLLFHGALEAHPAFGMALPVATALNAIAILRLVARLFLGRAHGAVPDVPDARMAERLALSCCVLVLVLGGLFPSIPIAVGRTAVHDEPAAIAAATR